MERGKLTKRELDELGKRFVIAAKPGEGEIDLLVSDPRLYEGVLAKIANASAGKRRRAFSWKPAAGAAMAVALLSIPLLALLKFSGANEPTISGLRVTPYEVKEKPFVHEEPKREEPAESRDSDEPRPVPAVLTRAVEPPPPPKTKRPRQPVRLPEPEPAFVPIGMPERAEDAALDGRVVRVEMPRAALFAMGVDVPLENGTRSIKADLLVGSDGSPRAIRLVE